MKKTIVIILTLCMVLTTPAFAYNYDFSTGDDNVFGTPTNGDEPVSPDPMSENTRRNKDNADLPPPYFYGSGDIPTDPSSPFHDNMPPDAGYTGGTPDFPDTDPSLPAATAPLLYEDGSIGTLYIERTGTTITVYEGEQLDNLKKGAGHFTSTSAWNGNVALCGHNRGSAPYFSFVKDMQTGDRVTYTTQYGSHTYAMFSKEQIDEYDYSKLGWSTDNLLTLITCIEDVPELRWAVQLREV